jgi:hypothetical protein
MAERVGCIGLGWPNSVQGPIAPNRSAVKLHEEWAGEESHTQ